MTLSKREKRMLYMLGCFLLISACMYLLILPAVNTRIALDQQLQALEEQRLVRIQSIARMGALDTRVKELRKEIETRSTRYAPPLLSEILDSQFTIMLRLVNAVPMEFTIGEVNNDTAVPHYGERTDFGGVELSIADVPPLNEYMAAVNTKKNEEPKPPEEPATDTMVDVNAPTTSAQALTIEAIMSRASAMAFMEMLSSDPAIVVNNLDIADVVTLTTSITGESSVSTGNVTLTVEFLSLLAPNISIYGDEATDTPNLTFS